MNIIKAIDTNVLFAIPRFCGGYVRAIAKDTSNRFHFLHLVDFDQFLIEYEHRLFYLDVV